MSGLDSHTKLSLLYFPIGGRAEAIRLTAAAGGIAFTNKVLTFPEFMEVKHDKELIPLGQVPVLHIEKDGKTRTVTQSLAILRYFGKIGGLYPSDEILALDVDSLLALLEDLLKTLILTVGGAVSALVSDTEWTGEEKIKIRKRWIEKSLPKFLGFIEDTLKSSKSGWLVGDSVTIADINLYTDLTWVSSGILDGIPTTVLDEYPGCKELMEKVKTVNGIEQWTDKYSKPYSSFDYEP
jgi:glutathione S-transferase